MAILSFSPAIIESSRVEHNGAIIVCNEPEHDFGVVWADAELSHTFVITNTGRTNAQITVTPVGGTNLMTGRVLEPGESVEINRRLNARKLGGPFEFPIAVKVIVPSDAIESCAHCGAAADAALHPRICTLSRSNSENQGH